MENTGQSGARFLTKLAPRYGLGASTVARLAPKVEQLLAEAFTEATLLARLTRAIDGEYSPAAAIVRRVEKLAVELQKGHTPPVRPAWCGECDEHTRLREKPDSGLPYRCHCHPRSVGATASAS